MIFCSWVISWSPSLCRRAGRGPSSWCEPRPASGASAKTNNDCQIKFELLHDIRVIQTLLGHAKLDTTALYTRVANTTIRTVTSPLDRLALLIQGRPRPAG